MVDIIIPVYNALDTLELAVTSALMQGDVRILLVDDGSTDGTARLCDELAHHPRIAVFIRKTAGCLPHETQGYKRQRRNG